MSHRRPSDNSFVNLINGNVSGQSSYGRYSVSTANGQSSVRPAAQDHGNSSSRADHSFGSGWRAEARAKVQSSRVFSHPYAKPVVKSTGYVYGSPNGSAGYGSYRAPYFNRGNQSTSSSQPAYYNRLSWNKTFSNNQATSFGHENRMHGQLHTYRDGAPATQSFHNRSMTGMEFVHGRGNVQSMNFTVFRNMDANRSEHPPASSSNSNVHQQESSSNGHNEYGRSQIRLTVDQLFGRPEGSTVQIDSIRPHQDDSERLAEGFKNPVDQQSSGRSITPPSDHRSTPLGVLAEAEEDGGFEAHVKKGTPLMRLSAFESQTAKKTSTTSSPDGNFISSCSSSSVKADNDVNTNGGDRAIGKTSQPMKEVPTNAPAVSVQGGKPKRKRTRSRKSSRANKSLNDDKTIGCHEDGSQYLDEPILDEPTGGIAVSKPNYKNSPPGFSARPSKHAGMESSVKRGFHPMVIPEFKGQGTSKQSPAVSDDRRVKSLAQEKPVASRNCDGQDEWEENTSPAMKEVPNDAPSVSDQGVKPKRKRNRSKKTSKANQSFSADKTVGSYKDDSQYLDESIADEPTEGFTVFQNMDSQFKGLTISRKAASPILNLTMDVAPTEFDVTLPESNLNQTFSGILKVGKKNSRPKSVVFGKFPTPLARSETFAELHPPRHPLARAGWKNSCRLINLEALEFELYDEYVGIYKAHSCTDKMRQMPEIVVDKDTVYFCIEGTDELLELPPNFEFNLYPVEELPSGVVMAGRYKYMFDDEKDKLGKLLKTVCTASMKNQWTQSNLPELMLKYRVTPIAPEKVVPIDDDCLVPDEELSDYHRVMRKSFLKRFKVLPASPPIDLPEDVDCWTPPDLSRARQLADMQAHARFKKNGFWTMKDNSPKEKDPVEDQKTDSHRVKRPLMLPKQVKVGRAEYALPGSRVGALHTFSPECVANGAPSSDPTISSFPSADGMSTPTKLVSPSMFDPLASSTPRKDSDSEGREPIVRRLRDPMDDIPSTSGSAPQCSSHMMETPKVHKPRDRKPKGHWKRGAVLENPPSSD